MSKDRTKQQDFDLIKGLIDSKKDFNIFQVLKNENISLVEFFYIYRRFLLTNYMDEKLNKLQRKNVSNYLVKKGVYKSRYAVYSCYLVLSNKSLKPSGSYFFERTYKSAIDQISLIKKEVLFFDESINSFCEKDNTYSNEFISLCEKYNLRPSVERGKKKTKYKLTKPKKENKEKKKTTMNKGRTKKQDFEMVKNWITEENPTSVLQLLQNENINVRYLKKVYSWFFLSNYRGETRGRETIRAVTRLIVEKKLYGNNTCHYFYDKEIDNTSEEFKIRTIETAIERFIEVRKESQNLIDGIDNFYKTKTMNTGEFNHFCWRYGLDSLRERKIKTKNEEYRLKAYIRKVKGEAIPKKKKNIDTTEEKYRQFYFLKKLSQLHYAGRIYAQDNLAELRKYGFNGYEEEKILKKIKEIEKSIQ